MTLPFYVDLDADMAQSFGNLIWATVVLEGLVNRVCMTLLGSDWHEGRRVGKSIESARAIAESRHDSAGLQATRWLDEAKSHTYLRNQVLHATVAAHMDPADLSKVASYSLRNVRWDQHTERDVETLTPLTVENLETIRSRVESAIQGFTAVDIALVA